MKKSVLFCALFALLLVFSSLACAEGLSLTYGSFTLTLPSGFSPDPEDEGFFSSGFTGLYISYHTRREKTLEEHIEYDYSYARKYNPNDETRLVKASPYVAFMIIDPDGTDLTKVFIDYRDEGLSIYTFSLFNSTNSVSVANEILDSIVFSEPAPASESASEPSQPADEFLLPVPFDSVTVYLPECFALNPSSDTPIYDDTSGRYNASVFIVSDRVYDADLFTTEAEREAFLQSRLEIALASEGVLSCDTVRLDSCDVLNADVAVLDRSTKALFIITPREILSLGLFTMDIDNEPALSVLADGIIAHIVAPEVPLDP